MDEKKKREQNTREEPSADIREELKKLRKPAYAIAMLLSGAGMVIALVLAFVINDALDKTGSAIDANLDAVYRMAAGLDGAIVALEGEVVEVNATLDDLNSSISTLADGIGGTGTTMKQLGATLSLINLPGFPLAQYGSGLSDSGEKMLNGSSQLKEAGALSGHRERLGGLMDSLISMRQDLQNLGTEIAQARASISDVIGLIRLANVLVFVLFVAMFGVLILNSAAGLF